jgi:hypothetical protein
MIENPQRIGCKPKFICRICKGNHLTHLCPIIVVVHEAKYLSDRPLGFELSLVFQHSNTSLVETMVVSMQSLDKTTFLLGGDAFLDHVVTHLVQPMVLSMQSLVDTILVLGGDVSLNHVFLHPIQPMVEEVVMPIIDPTLLWERHKSKEVILSMQ